MFKGTIIRIRRGLFSEFVNAKIYHLKRNTVNSGSPLITIRAAVTSTRYLLTSVLLKSKLPNVIISKSVDNK